MPDSETFQIMEGWLTKLRGHKSYFECPDKPIKEFGVVRELLLAQREKSGFCWIRPRSLKSNPVCNVAPDCIGVGIVQEKVGFEVTELLDQATVEENIRGAYEMKEWSEEQVRSKIASQLSDKDGKELRGGPFSKYVVVIHTDEPLLRYEDCFAYLQGHTFGPFCKIDGAFLILSPDPGDSYSPYICLNTRKKL